MPEKEADCIWECDDDSSYSTDCGYEFMLNEGNPEENGMKFCPFCGRKLDKKGYQDG